MDSADAAAGSSGAARSFGDSAADTAGDSAADSSDSTSDSAADSIYDDSDDETKHHAFDYARHAPRAPLYCLNRFLTRDMPDLLTELRAFDESLDKIARDLDAQREQRAAAEARHDREEAAWRARSVKYEQKARDTAALFAKLTAVLARRARAKKQKPTGDTERTEHAEHE